MLNKLITSKGLKTPQSESLVILNSPVPQPVIPTKQDTPGKSVDREDVDMDALCEGAEDWDWTDMDVDDGLSTPSRKVLSCTSLLYPWFIPGIPLQNNSEFPLPPPFVRQPCTRCIVESVIKADFAEKVCYLCPYI